MMDCIGAIEVMGANREVAIENGLIEVLDCFNNGTEFYMVRQYFIRKI